MRSSLIIRGEPLAQNKSLSEMMECMASLTALSVRLVSPISLTMQHNIREDHFAVIVETKTRSFGHFGKNFEEVFKKLRKEVDKELKREELFSAKKQVAGEARSKRSRRKGPEGKRLKRIRKG